MRIELNAGGLGGVSIASCQANLNKFSSSAQSVCSGFNTVQKALNNVTGGMNGTLQTVSGYVGQRIKQESQKIQNVAETTKQTICFLNDTISTDKRVANIVNKNNSNFYKVNPHLKPNKTSFLGGLFKNVCSLLDKGRKVLDFVKSLPKKIVEFGVKCFKCAAKVLKENIHKLLEFGKQALDYMVDTVKKVWKSIWDFLTTDGVFDIIAGVLTIGVSIAAILAGGPIGVIAAIGLFFAFDSGFNNIMDGIEKVVKNKCPDFELPSWLEPAYSLFRRGMSPISYGLKNDLNGLFGNGVGDTTVKILNTIVQIVNIFDFGSKLELGLNIAGAVSDVTNNWLDVKENDGNYDTKMGIKYILTIISSVCGLKNARISKTGSGTKSVSRQGIVLNKN